MADHEETLTQHKSSSRRPRGRARLLVLDVDGSSMVDLPEEGTLLIGRTDEADVRLKDKSVSRRHAHLLVEQGVIRIADLDSHNGVRVNGVSTNAAHVLSPGDVVSIGEVTLVLYVEALAEPAAMLLTAEALKRRLVEEVARATEYERPLALLCIAFSAAVAARAGIGQRLAEALRLTEVAGWGEEGQLFVLFPERDPSGMRRALERVREALAPAGTAFRMGLGFCPTDGCDAATLLAAARAAAAAAPAGGLLGAAELASEIRLGERVVVVTDPAMMRIYDLIRRLAQSELPVLISGETGAGKENAAYAVHFWSRRAGAPFLAINCAAIAETLVESELFGHEKGAFTGAQAQKTGLLEAATGGTVFLDEIGELGAAVQAKLLRALETRRILRVGGVKEREIDIRVVAATHRNLEAEVAAGRFRKDLFFRLGVATVVLPPLRDRPREVALLARRFIDMACTAAGREPMSLSPATLVALGRYDWPGNVRELKNTMDYVTAAVPEEVVEPWHLPERITASLVEGAEGSEAAPAAPMAPGAGTGSGPRAILGEGAAAAPAGGPEAVRGAEEPRRRRPLAEEIKALERERMAEALREAGGVKVRAAELLAMPIRTFALKCKQYGL